MPVEIALLTADHKVHEPITEITRRDEGTHQGAMQIAHEIGRRVVPTDEIAKHEEERRGSTRTDQAMKNDAVTGVLNKTCEHFRIQPTDDALLKLSPLLGKAIGSRLV